MFSCGETCDCPTAVVVTEDRTGVLQTHRIMPAIANQQLNNVNDANLAFRIAYIYEKTKELEPILLSQYCMMSSEIARPFSNYYDFT